MGLPDLHFDFFVVCADMSAYLGCDKEAVGVQVSAPKCAHVKDAHRKSSIYHNMINLVLGIVIRG